MDIIKEKKYIMRSKDYYGEKTYETIIAKKEVSIESNDVTFKYEAKLGACIIKYDNKKLHIKRGGETSAEFFLELDKTHKLLYKSNFLNSELKVRAKKIYVDLEKGLISFAYEIKDENENFINSIEVDIKEIKSTGGGI